MPKREFEVVGAQYRVTPSTLEEMSLDEPLLAEVVREPDNENDENALKVVITERPWKGFHIGYLRREVAAEFSPEIDAGRIRLDRARVSNFDLKEAKVTVTLTVRRL